MDELPIAWADSTTNFIRYIPCMVLVFFFFQAYSWFRWYSRRLEFQFFARENGCAVPPTITSSLIKGIRHKWRRLNQAGDIFNDYMNNVFRDNGATHAIAKPITGDVKTIYTIDPANVRTMLSTKFQDYHRPRTMPNALNPVMGEGVFTSNGDAWAHSRGLVKSQFSMRRIREVKKLEIHVQNMFEALGAEPKSSWTEEQELLLIFNRFTLDAATEFMFGTSAQSHEAFMRERSSGSGTRNNDFWARNSLLMADFGTAFDTALDYVALRLKLGRLWFLADGLSFRLACRTVKNFADRYIRDAAAHAAEAAQRRKTDQSSNTNELDDRRYGLISNLIDDYPDKVALRNQVMQLLVAGRDTTAATLAWTFVLLESHPNIFGKLRDAVVAIFGTESNPRASVNFENIRACTYLQWVIFEVVRLYPTGPLNARRASCDTILPVGGGSDGRSPVAVKAGTTVAYNTYLMHRRKELWGEDSWDFRPERWSQRKIGWEYIPFHGGPQTCLGQQHALTEMAYVIVRILQRFDAIESPTRATNFQNGIRTILVPKNRVLFRLRRSMK